MAYQLYKFHYPSNGFEQTKVLVSHVAWQKVDAMPESTEEQQETKAKAMRELTGGYEWFTDQSLYYHAIETGVIMANGYHRCNVTKL